MTDELPSEIGMGRYQTSLTPSYFEKLYAERSDPWSFATSDYEAEKQAATLGALPRQRYGSAFEVGCSIGVLTAQLAKRCDSLLSIDVSSVALEQAKVRCTNATNVRFDLMRVPEEWPAGSFDLILFSEMVYYLDQADVARLVAQAVGAIRLGGDIVLVHWLGETHYPLTGDEASNLFIQKAAGFAQVTHQQRTDEYRLDVLTT